LNVSITRQARRDIAQAADWYERKMNGLGEEFLDRVQEGIDRIGLNPLRLYQNRWRKSTLQPGSVPLWVMVQNR
jgi:hypothetical protein